MFEDVCESLVQEILTKMSAVELKVKVECGAVSKELDPTIPAETQDTLKEKIHRYRFSQQSGKTTTAVKREQEKTVDAVGGEVHV